MIEDRYHVCGDWPGDDRAQAELVETFRTKAEAIDFAKREVGPRRYGRAWVIDTMGRRGSNRVRFEAILTPDGPTFAWHGAHVRPHPLGEKAPK